jgi:hypothetical protein
VTIVRERVWRRTIEAYGVQNVVILFKMAFQR